jgi:hypothetical protein
MNMSPPFPKSKIKQEIDSKQSSGFLLPKRALALKGAHGVVNLKMYVFIIRI